MEYKKIEFTENLSLYDSKINKISIYNLENIIQAEILIKASYPYNTFVKIIFKNVTFYSLYWDDNFLFYTIDSYKLLASENEIYCSLDPYDYRSIIHDEDRDVIRSTSIEVYYSSDINFKECKKIAFSSTPF